MHNNIMPVGLRDRLPLLTLGRYAQWQSRFLRYIDTRPNGDALRKCILEGPYQLTIVTIPDVLTTDDTQAFLERTGVETILNIDEIYSTVDACKTAHDMWIAIERLQQVESLNIQDVKTNLFWEFGIFTSHDGESMESYYSSIKKKVNEMCAKRIAKNANPLTLVAAAQQYPDTYYQITKPEQAQRDKDMQKNLALITKYLKKLYKPTNNNLRTSSNSRNKNVDTTPRETIAEKGVPLQAEQADWLEDMNEEIDEQELEAHYGFIAKIQEVLPPESDSTVEPLEQVDSNVIPNSTNMYDNDIQTDQNAEDECAVLANLIVNLTLDTEENKKILKQIKKANASLTQELKELHNLN
ncbi:hypothetical protein Tco_1378868 [Tanacetum coccineum]